MTLCRASWLQFALMLISVALVFFTIAVAVGWWLREKWLERHHLEARLARTRESS
jgi:hypothetical protein